MIEREITPEAAAQAESIDRPSMDVDIVCVGFGPAAGGFLTTLTRAINDPGAPLESRAMPGMPLQVICYERADDIGFGVSGVVTRARGIRASFPEFPADLPMATPVTEEKVVYLLDPNGASRRPATMRLADKALRALGRTAHAAFELPWTPEFLRKHDGFVMSIGQFNQWVGSQVMMSGAAQIWPASPVSAPLTEQRTVRGVRLTDQGAGDYFQPGMDVRAALTVVADGPVGAVSREIDARLGAPAGHTRDEWAVGMKFVIDLPETADLAPGTVIHTIGYPEPEIFGFFYVHPDRIASAGIFVPSWFDSPVRSTYRYLQHFVQHPYLWRHIRGGRLRSWGAKSLLESGRRAEPHLAGDGYARIGEGSGTTNVLTGSGVDEAWTSGVQLAESVIELLREGQPFTKTNLQATYVKRRRESWLDTESLIAERARDGFQHGVIQGFLGMGLAGLSNGKLSLHRTDPKRVRTAEQFFAGRIPASEIAEIRARCKAEGSTLHDALMERAGWPKIEYDGQLLMTHQDALLMGGKVQAPPAAADHVGFTEPELCRTCGAAVCVEICSAEAIHPGEGPAPAFDREKCVHCGACLWSCESGNISFRAGPGGLHSAEN